jgi:predicted DNA-binding protein (MmcQ/YjbR family)
MPSHIDWVRELCISLPHTTEDIQWGNDLLFRIAKKIYCVVCLEPKAPVKFSFKCTPEKFAELVEIEGIIPAPYMARNNWVAIVELSALRQPEIKELIRNSYQLVFEKLPKKLQNELGNSNSSPERGHEGRKRRTTVTRRSKSSS